MQEAEGLPTVVAADVWRSPRLRLAAAVRGKETTPSPREVVKTSRQILFILFQRSIMKYHTEDSLNNFVLSLGDLAFPHTSLYVGSSPLQPNTFCTG